MTTTLRKPLLAKLMPPRMKQPLMRERLFRQLDDGGGSIWLYGPPGSGKTTLVASYLQQYKLKVLWYRVDSDDREPSTFFHFLAEAKAAIGSRRAALPVIAVETRDDWPAFARRFARALAAALPTGCALVFDNVHEGAGGLDALLAVMIEEMTEFHRVFLLSHHAPPTPFVTAITKQQLSIIAADGLRLDRAETAALAKALGLGKQGDVERAYALTNGWAAAIVLLASQPGGELLMDAEGKLPPQMLEYMSHNVIKRIPERVRHVVESCAFFPDFDAALACAASADPVAGELLADLHRSGFFIEQRGTGAEKSYALHSLLVEALRQKVGLNGSAARQLAEANAGKLLLRAGRAESGIALLLAGLAHAEAAPHILNIAKHMMATGRGEQLARWISALPAALLDEQPWLEYWRALATASFNLSEARRVFDEVCQRFRAKGDRLGVVLAAAAVTAEIELSWQSTHGAQHWVNVLYEAWTADIVFPDAESELRAIIGALATVNHDAEMLSTRRDRYIDRLLELIPATSDPNLHLHAGSLMIYIMTLLRNFERGLPFVNFIHQQVDLKKAHPGHVANWLNQVARLYVAAGDALDRPELFKEARRVRNEALLVAQRHGDISMQIVMGHAEALAALNAQDTATAAKILNTVEPLLMPTMYWHLAWHHTRRSRLCLMLEHPVEALEHIEKVLKYAAQAGAVMNFTANYNHAAAFCLMWLDRHDEAEVQIATAISKVATEYADVYRLSSLFNRALRAVKLEQGEANETIRAFFVSLVDGQIFDYGQSARPLIARLCAVALTRAIEPAMVRDLIKRRKLAPTVNAPADWPWPVKIESLSGFNVYSWDEPLVFDGKTQKKPMELLKLLVARSDPLKPNQGVDVEEIISELWPSADAKDPKGSFDVTVHRLRKLLKVEEAIVISEGRLRLNRDFVWCDAFVFESMAIQTLRGERSEIGTTLALYRGALFGNEKAPWAFSTRERIAVRFTLLVQRQGEVLESAGAYREAVDVYERGIAQDNLVEPFYRGLMRCHLARGEPAEALRAYRRCREILSIVLGLRPAPETDALRQQIPAGQS
ncbi:MAG: hypothetical protein LH481_17785 [Burkholderiales bacterium]|nr:hypothetical protein [Burkholderiales bacterium]